MLPGRLSLTSNIVYRVDLGVDAAGVRSYIGSHHIGGSTHPVLIKHRPLLPFGRQSPTAEVQEVIDAEPLFVGHLFTTISRGEVITVRDPQWCTEVLRQLPVWKIVRACLSLLLRFHRAGYHHNGISAGRFVIASAGPRFVTRLSGFHAAEAIPEDRQLYGASYRDEVTRFAGVIRDLLADVRLVSPDFADERFTLIEDLVACQFLSPVTPCFSLENLLSHPAVADYSCLQGLGCVVSDFFDTYPGNGDNPGYIVLRAVEEASGDDFLEWWGNFDIRGSVHFNTSPRARIPRGLFNALDRTHSLQYAIRAFRNRTVHRSDLLDRLYGGPGSRTFHVCGHACGFAS